MKVDVLNPVKVKITTVSSNPAHADLNGLKVYARLEDAFGEIFARTGAEMCEVRRGTDCDFEIDVHDEQWA